MLLGLILGLLAGAGLASLLKPETAEAPSNTTLKPVETDAAGVVDKLKHHVEEAKSAAKQASDEKQAELQRRYDEAMKGS